MDPLFEALRGAQQLPAPAPAMPAAQPAPAQRLLVVGAGGKLGAAVLEQALAAGRFAAVQALVAEPLTLAVAGLQALQAADIESAASPGAQAPACGSEGALKIADTGVIVFERQRHSNGRDAAFVQPQPEALVALAHGLRLAGMLRLLVVLPHSPALLPHALAHGLASLDEAAVAALGFEQLVFFRAAQHGSALASAGAMQRLAGWWLSQLRWMVPAQDQPLRADSLAACVVQLARCLPTASQGTRVLAPSTLWPMTRPGVDLALELQRWLGAAHQ